MIRRLGGALVVLIVASILAFVLLRLLPGDPARMILGPLASNEAVEAQQRLMGLDRPIPAQYLRYIADLSAGDLGFAWHTGRPVSVELLARFPATAELAILALLVALASAMLLGVLAVVYYDGWIDRLARTLALGSQAMPSFWFGLLLLMLFFFYLGLLPAPLGRLSPAMQTPPTVTGFLTIDSLVAGEGAVFWETLRHLVLPVTTLSFALFPYLFRVLRASLLEVLNQPYMTVSAAKGLSEWRRIAVHALPNAILPMLTAAGMAFGELLAGSVLVEKVFLWPGIGGFLTESVLSKDYAAVQAVIVLSAGAYILVNLIVDLLYGVLNPRVRTG